MKIIRRLTFVLFCLTLLIACSKNEASKTMSEETTKDAVEEKDDQEQAVSKVVVGVYDNNHNDFSKEVLKALFTEKDFENYSFDDLGSYHDAKIALERKDVDMLMWVPQQEEIEGFAHTYSYYEDEEGSNYWSFIVRDEEKALLDFLNSGLKSLKDNGTLQNLKDHYESIELPDDEKSSTKKASENQSVKLEENPQKPQAQESKPPSNKAKDIAQEEAIVQVENGHYQLKKVKLVMTIDHVHSLLGTPDYEGQQKGEMISYDLISEYGNLTVGYYNGFVDGVTYSTDQNVLNKQWYKELGEIDSGDRNGIHFFLKNDELIKFEPYHNKMIIWLSYPGPNYEGESTNTDALSISEAENLVRSYLDLDNRPEIIVDYDHEENGEYVIHVYEIVSEGTELAHTATWDWLYVNPHTKEIRSMFE